jgi:small subunit ribosomal protein S1
VKHPSEVLKKGDKVKAVVLAIEPEKRRLSLGVKQLQPDVWETFFAAHHKIGDVVHGKVLRWPLRRVRRDRRGRRGPLCHNSEAPTSNGGREARAGQEHDFKIIKMNPEEKKVGLSMRAVGEEANQPQRSRRAVTVGL